MELISILQIMSFVISLLILGYIIVLRIENRRSMKHGSQESIEPETETVKPEPKEFCICGEEHTHIDMVPLEKLRVTGYHGLRKKEDVEKVIFFIDDSAMDAIGIFVKVVPDILSILMRTSHIMKEIDKSMDYNDVHEKEIQEKLIAMNMALESLTMVTSTLGHKIYEITSKKGAEREQSEASPELVWGFIEMTSDMLDYVFEYLDSNNIVYQKIKERNLIFKEDFSEMSSGFLHIFFYGIMNCITMVESSITVLKH